MKTQQQQRQQNHQQQQQFIMMIGGYSKNHQMSLLNENSQCRFELKRYLFADS